MQMYSQALALSYQELPHLTKFPWSCGHQVETEFRVKSLKWHAPLNISHTLLIYTMQLYAPNFGL